MRTVTRRRGQELDAAILDAAWTELTDRGYRGLTLESVASRAKTSRPVLHRRWSGPARLAAAALARYVGSNPVSVPDLGSVRKETRLLLRRVDDRAPQGVMRFVIEMQDDLRSAGRTSHSCGTRLASATSSERYSRGVDRGEVHRDRITPRIVSLPIDLTLLEGLMTLKPVSGDVIAQIVDDVFLPLVRRAD